MRSASLAAGMLLSFIMAGGASGAPSAAAAPGAAQAAAGPAAAASSAGVEAFPIDYQALAERIVTQLALQPGEKVLLLAHPGTFSELVSPLRHAITRAGGIDMGCWLVLPQPPPAAARLDEAAAARGVAASRAALVELLRNVDAAVMMQGASTEHPEYAAMQDVLRQGHGRTVHFHWRGSGVALSAIELPGHPLPPDPVIDAIYQHAVLHSDCKAVGEVQRRFAAALAAGEVHVTTPAGTDLRWRRGERPINFQDGDASAARARQAHVLVDREIEIPCGAIRVAPVEETVAGTIAFPPAVWNGRPGGPVTLRFVRGRVAEVIVPPGPAAAETRAAVEAELARAGDAARSFREMALGFNPELEIPAATPFIPYYGYGAGVIRLSLGDNTELGGKVKGPYVRWNFFADATVTVGDQVWVRGGKLLPPG